MAPMRCLVLLAVAGLAACGQADERAAARGTVEAFYDAVRAGDAAAACERLSEAARDALEPSCEARITGLDLDGGALTGVEVQAVNAVVTSRSGEQTFLSRGAGGWTISALGCAGATRRAPADCEVEA
jgi:hypothetical protein